MSFQQLPVETICKIFVYSTQIDAIPLVQKSSDSATEYQNTLPSNALPDTLAAVCSRWRSIALSYPLLWATLFLALNLPQGLDEMHAIVRSARKAVDHCISRSADMSLSLFVTITIENRTFIARDSDIEIQTLLLAALFTQQSRWRVAHLHLPFVQGGEEAYGARLPTRSFRVDDLQMLRDLEVNIETCSIVDGTISPPILPSLTHLKLLRFEIPGAAEWLRRTPNVEELTLMSLKYLDLDEMWVAGLYHNKITLRNLQRLKLTSTRSTGMLRFLECPVLQDLHLVFSGKMDNFIARCVYFLSHNHPRRLLSLHNIPEAFFKDKPTMRLFFNQSLRIVQLFQPSGLDRAPVDATELINFLLETRREESQIEQFTELPCLECFELRGAFHVPHSLIDSFVSKRLGAENHTLTNVILPD